MSIRVRAALAIAAAMPMAILAQTPAISAVVDAASYAPTWGAQDAIVTIFGANLAAAPATAQGLPQPEQLGGTRVMWYGVAAPLFYVSPTQINLEVPIPYLSGLGGVVVSTSAGSSAPYQVDSAMPNVTSQAGLFSTNGSGCGQAAAFNVADDGSMSVNSATNSASPGQWISVWGTGASAANSYEMAPPGAATPSSPLYNDLLLWPEFDFSPQSYSSSQFWSGFAPGLVAVNQYNVQIPETAREGCAVPVQLWDYFASAPTFAMSQPLTIAIRKGGGACVDPPPAGFGQITWQKTVSTTAAQVSTESDAVTVSLQSSPGMQPPPAPVYSEEAGLPAYTPVLGPSCGVPGYRSLSAGTVTAQGPGLGATQLAESPYPQGQVGGLSAYRATLPTGAALQSGAYAISGSGGADVAAFQATAQLPADIQIQTPLAGAPLFVNCAPLVVNWTGGDPNAWVSVRFLQGFFVTGAFGEYQVSNFSARARVSDGSVTIYGPPYIASNATEECPVASLSGVVSVEVDPGPSELTTFSAPGLALGGQVTWKYVHTFAAMTEKN